MREQADQGKAQPVELAEVKAWLTKGQSHLEEGDAEATIACARKGIAALGNSYYSYLVADDTSLSILWAEENIRKGQIEEAASGLLSVLEERIGLYERKHALMK